MPMFNSREEYEKWKAERDRRMKEIYKKDIRSQDLLEEAMSQIKAKKDAEKEAKTESAYSGDMYMCQGANCGYIYSSDTEDEKGGIAPGTGFEDLPDSWKCPKCGAGKGLFKNLE
ncbi:rubredoxin-2 [bacterium BMS3Abin10]|nr:rubredoxin-2 [bacterium BMS3Abin10]GBE39541.1 rubredoxin-2 [bacterium BMS3Bbin08]